MAKVKLSRDQFLSWIGEDPTFQRADSIAAAGGGHTKGEGGVIVSDDWPAGSVADSLSIVLEDTKAQDEFFAFVSTYISTYVPFSAFFRVVTKNDLELKYVTSQGLSIEELLRPLTGAVLSGAAGSPSSRSRGTSAFNDILLSRHFCFGKAAISPDAHQFEKLVVRWEACQKVLGSTHSQRLLDRDDLFWRTMFALRNGASAPVERLAGVAVTLLRRKALDSEVWEAVGSICPPAKNLRRDMEMSRELRARAFTKFIDQGALEVLGAESDFLVGFLGAALGGGRMEYSGLIERLTEFYPDAGLWFGFVCGCITGSDVLSSDGSLGRHVQRQLLTGSSIGRSDTEISFGELRVIGTEKGGLEAVRSRTAGSMWVELAPDLVIPFKRYSADERTPPTGGAAAGAVDVQEALALARRLTQVLQRAGNLPGDDLFPSKPVRKRSKRAP